jgi:LacI family transcriptional regulator
MGRPRTAKPTAPRQPVRLADVAERAGVGTSIVSRVLNEDPTASVRPETRERILEAARNLGYRPHFLGRALRATRSTTLALIIPHLADTVNAAILRGAARAAAAQGYALLVSDADDFLAGADAAAPLLLDGRVDGFLLAGGETSDTATRFLTDLRRSAIPFVAVNRRIAGVEPNVSMDDALGMEMLVRHLVELGHRRIAHIAGPEEADTARRRLEGYRRGLRAAGLRTSSSAVARSTLDESEGHAAMERLLELRPRPTAVVVWSLSAAVGALAAAREHGIAVPGDVSVAAFHDAPMCEFLEPSLTTVRMPLYELSQMAVQVLLDVIAGASPGNVVLDAPAPSVVVRRSTGPVPAA